MTIPQALAAAALLASPLLAAEKQDAPKPAPPPATAPAPAAEAEKPSGTPAEQLEAAQKRLTMLKLHYDEKHPAILKQRAQVIRLQKAVREEAAEKGPLTREQQLAAAKAELEELLKKFTEQHPRVKMLRQHIARLERG